MPNTATTTKTPHPVLWLVRPFAWLGGTLLDVDSSPQGRLLAFAMGLAQLLGSCLTACGLAAYMALQRWTQGEVPPWSWSSAGYILCGVLVFDMAFNVALNHAWGWRHLILKLIRLGITIVLSWQASHMVMLMAQAPSLAEPARTVARERFEATLVDLRTIATNAAQAESLANKALADHVAKPPVMKSSDESPTCAQASLPVAEGDGRALRIQRQNRDVCLKQQGLIMKAFETELSAFEATRAVLATKAASAKSLADHAQTASAAREALRDETVAQLSSTPAIRQAAFELLQDQDPTLRIQTWMTAGLLMMLEVLALCLKTFLRSRDEASLTDRIALLGQTNNLLAQVLAHETMAHAYSRLPISATLLALDHARTNHQHLVQEAALPPTTAATYHAWMHREMRKSRHEQPPRPASAMA